MGNEDKNLRTFRRAVGFGQNIKKDLVPILIHVKDDPKILELTIKILVNLTIPIECLLSMDELSKNNVGRHTIFELNNLLISSKEAFVDNRVTKSLLDYTNRIYENDRKLSPASIDNINNCLLLIRNILHIPEIKTPEQAFIKISSQNQFLWHLFTHGIDKTLLILISSPYGVFFLFYPYTSNSKNMYLIPLIYILDFLVRCNCSTDCFDLQRSTHRNLTKTFEYVVRVIFV